MVNSRGKMFVLKNILFLLIVVAVAKVIGWGSSHEKVRLKDIDVLTLRHNHVTNGRRSASVPQLKCVGGTAGCSAFVPKVVQCYNRGSDGYDVQWECKTDMDSQYRFGEIAVSCEGYDHPDDPYVLKGSCGLEYTIDYVGGNQGQQDNGYNSGHDSGHHSSNHGHKRHHSHHRSSGWLSTFIMWGIIAAIAYYVYTTCTANAHSPGDGTQYASHQTSSAPPPPGFRPEYTQGTQGYPSGTPNAGSPPSDNQGFGGFWTGLGTGGVLGYLFGGNRGGRGYYDRTHHGYGTPGYGGYGTPGYGSGYGGGSWFGGNGGGSWFGGNGGGSSSWFGSGHNTNSSWSSTHRRSSPSSSGSSPTSRTASGFGGTKRR